ncbi:MAG: ATP-binding protein, partial [Oscillospiraceae bacterium]|nr:ATP-binding protein [Oscillospiraceae bacterium]
ERPLVPLYEAVVNSIHAIEERRKSDEKFTEGYIAVRAIRAQQLTLDFTDLPEIIGFEVTDNGIGFTEENMRSFLESDSTHKAEIGGKGVGRFSWLKAFSAVNISSTYFEHNSFQTREFCFSINNAGIEDKLSDSQNNKYETTVKLESYLNSYQSYVPKNLSTVAIRIIQHCLIYFLDKNCPKIILSDDCSDTENLNILFSKKVKTTDRINSFSIKEQKFELLNVRIEDKTFPGNKLFLCANNRLVDSKDLEKYVVNLDNQLFECNGFSYVGILTSDYLDSNVDMNRLSFDIPTTNSSLSLTISMEEIISKSCDCVESFLKEYLSPIASEKEERIRRFVTEQAPQYRHLLKYKSDEITKLKPHLTDEKLDDEFHNIKRDFDKDTKREQKLLFEKIDKDGLALSEYEDLLKKQVERISDANTSALRNYIFHRRVILDMFERGLRKKDDGKFNKEKYMHNLIYPMRTVSTDIDYESHNLWLIDEKLSYCCYISSDIPFNDKEERTDILILDKPVAMSDNENNGTEFDTIILFELKRPMRNDYNEKENPITQLYKYVKRIRDGEVSDVNGRKVRCGSNTKFYLYAVCDTTDSLNDIIGERDLTQTPDKLGYYEFNKTYNSYLEVLSYDKILNDAKKRNRILFDKLGV